MIVKTVIVMGKGELAIRICKWFLANDDYNLKVVVPNNPEPSWTQSLSGWCHRTYTSHIVSGHYKDIIGVKNDDWSIDLVFSTFYDKIIKEWFIKKCKKIVNLHNAPLPKYRGVSPINWALKNKEIEHGVTIHEITPGIDDGPIISQIKYSIYPQFDEVIDVYKRSLKYGWILFEQTMPLLWKIEPKKQDESLATYCSIKDNERLGDRKNFTKKESK